MFPEAGRGRLADSGEAACSGEGSQRESRKSCVWEPATHTRADLGGGVGRTCSRMLSFSLSSRFHSIVGIGRFDITWRTSAATPLKAYSRFSFRLWPALGR